jgi:hypothetical protein
MFIGNTNDGTVCKINDGQHQAVSGVKTARV